MSMSTDEYNVLGIIFLSIFVLGLLGVLWLPSLMSLWKRDIKVLQVKYVLFLFILLACVTMLIFIAEVIGLSNPGGYIVASTILMSISGYFIAKRI